MLKFDIKSAHRMVAQQREAGTDVRWDGWDIVFFRPVEHARNTVDGVFRNGQWGFDNRSVVNSEGNWEIDPRNVKRIRRPRARR